MQTHFKPIALFVISSTIALGACSSKPKKLPMPSAPVPVVQQALPEIVETPRGPSLTIDDVLFDFDESGLKTEASQLIEVATSYLQDNPQYSAVIEGHADNTGDDTYNHELSLQRSQSVLNALTNTGISEQRLSSAAFGEERPIASNDTQTGRQANRRVEIIFSDGAAAPEDNFF